MRSFSNSRLNCSKCLARLETFESFRRLVIDLGIMDWVGVVAGFNAFRPSLSESLFSPVLLIPSNGLIVFSSALATWPLKSVCSSTTSWLGPLSTFGWQGWDLARYIGGDTVAPARRFPISAGLGIPEIWSFWKEFRKEGFPGIPGCSGVQLSKTPAWARSFSSTFGSVKLAPFWTLSPLLSLLGMERISSLTVTSDNIVRPARSSGRILSLSSPCWGASFVSDFTGRTAVAVNRLTSLAFTVSDSEACRSTTDFSISCAFSGLIVLVCGAIAETSPRFNFSVMISPGIDDPVLPSVEFRDVVESSRSKKIFLSCRVAKRRMSLSEGKKLRSNSENTTSHSATFSWVALKAWFRGIIS